MNINKPPKLFLSYCWSTPDHEAWVVRLATELTEAGIEVVFDKWDLKEGQEANAFMEKMVSDPDIHKVVMICDATYKRKADERKGGVGTESQIISQKVYSSQEQSKFVAVVLEKDLDGNALVPIYYSSRIYIDLSEPDKYVAEFERLVRWVYDKPLYERPKIGSTPSYLAKDSPVPSGTSSLCRRAISAMQESKPHARAALEDYFAEVSSNLERFQLSLSGRADDADQLILDSIDGILPVRDELISVFKTISSYDINLELVHAQHGLFESLIKYLDMQEGATNWTSWSADNFRFFVHEIFLYAVAIPLSRQRLDSVSVLLGQRYFSESSPNRGQEQLTSYTVFRKSIESLEARNRRLELRRISLQADLIKDRSEHSGIRFSELMQADFVMHLRAAFNGEYWHPCTLLYTTFNFYRAFEAFARAESKAYLVRLATLVLGLEDPLTLKEKLEELAAMGRRVPRWEYESLDIVRLSNAERLGLRQ